MPGIAIFALDLLLTALGIEATAWLVHRYLYFDALIGLQEATVASTSALAAATVGAYLVGLHEPTNLIDRRVSIVRSLVVGIAATSIAFLTAYFYWYLPTGRVAIALQGVGIGVALTSWRLIYRQFLVRGPRLPIIVLDDGPKARDFARRINELSHTRFRVIGHLGEPREHTDVDGDGIPAPDSGNAPRLGRLSAALETCSEHRCRTAVITSVPTPAEVEAIARLRARGVRVTSAAALTMEVARRLPAELLPEEWVLDVFERLDRSTGTETVKRIIDLVAASIGITVFAILVPLLYVAVKIDSRGPFFFVQERIGIGGQPFSMFKIRTMKVQAPDAEARWAGSSDARITRLGSLLRLTRLDEFPQFLNVLKGDMSIVGPRPEQPALIADLQARLPTFHFRHLVKPGITGWAQIQHGYAGSVDESVVKLAHDLYYVRNYSVRLDLDIMLRTFFVMAARVGAR
jgi:exopolysaccharide biosynthesis polyprenyl glycosylphosphotransferase